MVKASKPRHKESRRFGMDIYGTGGDSLARRLDIPPGGVRSRRARLSEYALRLREKQKVKAIYGIAESQFRRYYQEAARQKGATGANLLSLLERRLDNVVYRLGLARTRPMARQLVNHRHVLVNGRKVNIPSYLVRVGDTLTLDQTAAKMPQVLEEQEAARPVPDWLEKEGMGGRVKRLPTREDVDVPIQEALIVEFYARR